MTVQARDKEGRHVPAFRPGTTQTVSVTSSSAATTNPVGEATTIARLVCTVDCHVNVGESPTATTSNMLLPAYTVEYVRVVKGVDKVAAIRAAVDGTLYVTEAG